MKEGYQLASFLLYIEIRYVSKWYLSVKAPYIAEANGRLCSVHRSNKVLWSQDN